MPVMLMAAVPRFFSVTDLGAVVEPISVLANVRLRGETEMFEPMPERAIVSGLVTPLSVTVNVPVLIPEAVGVNSTIMVHEVPTVTELPQLLEVIMKSPVAATLFRVMVAV